MGVFLKKALTGNTLTFQYRTMTYQRLKNWYGSLVKPKPHEPPYRHVVQIGDPVLRGISDPVPVKLINSPETNFLVNHMTWVFKKYKCVGLSSPQIGIPLRVVVMEFSEEHAKKFTPEERKVQEMDILPFTVIINPEIKVLDYNKVIFSEACLSIRGFHADVPRYREIAVNGFNSEGQLINLHLRGWTARLLQHELDHLNGKLYTDIMDRKTFACSCWQEVNDYNGKISIPFGPE